MNLTRWLIRALLGRKLPTVEGAVTVPGLSRPVSIRRDRHGVAYVEGETDHDVWFGLGYCHAQDRAGQLEVIVRLVRGTLAEVMGSDGLPIDRLTRRLQVYRAGTAQFGVACPEVREQLAAYASGINACYEAGPKRPSHEHALLRCEPTRWEGQDSQAFAAYLCFMLAANWDMELMRMRILQADGVEALKTLEPVYPEWLETTLGGVASSPQSMERLIADLHALTPLFGVGGGSNAWAVAPHRTATGRPILANDPHLMPTAPSQWYLARLKSASWCAAGGTFVGTPALGCGHNGHVAWGVTAGHADHTDLFLEEVGPDGESVREGDVYVPCEVREEVITVKGRQSVTERVLMTPRGPIVGPCFTGQREAMSLAGTWLAPRPYAGLFSIHRAHTIAAVHEAFEESSTTNVGLVFAHRDGDIGYLLGADLPVRRKGWGMLPQPAWDGDAGWEASPLPQSALPRTLNPESGYVAAANAQPTAELGEVFLGGDWLDGYRQTRIAQALEARDDWDIEATAQLQMCTQSLPWGELREMVLLAASDPTIPASVLRLLTEWDGKLEPDSVAASVFQLFLARLTCRLVEAVAPRAAGVALGQGETALLPYSCITTRRAGHLVRMCRESRPGIFEAGWSEEVRGALCGAVETLHSRFGAAQEAWAWGRVRPMTLVHPFSQQSPLDRLFNIGPIPGRGDASTVHQGGMDLQEPTRNVIGCPTFRAVIDVGAWDNSRYILLGGQSGNPMSPHYTDQVSRWTGGQGVPIYWDDAELERQTVSRLVLGGAG